MIHNFNTEKSILNQFVAEVRNVDIQNDSMRFRRNMERIGEVLGYELSKYLDYSNVDIVTPLGVSSIELLSEQPVLASILRAGLPMHQGLLNYFDKAENSFISAYRSHTKNQEFEVKVEYLASPSLSNKTLIIADPMLATGQSMVAVFNKLLKIGIPKQVHLVVAIASQQAVDFVIANFPKGTHLWVGAIDDELSKKSYIIPGLGDAGDLAFGTKL